MRLDEAIKRGERKVKQNVFQVDPKALTALKILIEAGKRCQVLAENNPLWAAKPLPGETED